MNFTTLKPITQSQVVRVSENTNTSPAHALITSAVNRLKELGSKEFYTQITQQSRELFHHDQEQIMFLEQVFSKLDSYRIEFNRGASSTNFSGAAELMADIEKVGAELTKYIFELSPTSKYIDNTEELIKQKTSKLQDRETPSFISNWQSRRYADPVGAGVIHSQFGEKFVKKEGGGQYGKGNCGLNACFQATKGAGTASFDSVSARNHLVTLKNEFTKLDDPKQLNINLALVFGNLNNCKLFLDSALDEKLAVKDLNPEAKQHFTSLKNQIRSATDLDDFNNDPKTLSFIAQTLRLIDYNAPLEFSKAVEQDGHYLTDGDIKAIMLSKGYVFVGSNAQTQTPNNSSSDTYTFLQFQELSTKKFVHIAHQSVVGNQNYNHWVYAEPA